MMGDCIIAEHFVAQKHVESIVVQIIAPKAQEGRHHVATVALSTQTSMDRNYIVERGTGNGHMVIESGQYIRHLVN